MGWLSAKRRQQEQERGIARLREQNVQTRVTGLEAENARLREHNVQLQTRVAELEAENARLLSQLSAARKHSQNSSKPPSSDVVKPQGKRRKKKSKRRIGGQKGHPKHERPAFAPSQVDQRIRYRLQQCPVDAAHRIIPAEGQEHQRTLQQVELVKKPFKVCEHTAYSIWCHDCGAYHQAPLPKHLLKAGLFGPPCGELLELLPRQTHLNSDETGHKENGQRYWIWCFRAASFVVFKIDRSRGTEVLLRILGEDFKGILGCDYYAAYRKYARECSVLVQFCLAHLIRDVKYLCEFPHPRVQRYGQRLLEGIKALFWTLHRKDQLSVRSFESHLRQAQDRIWIAALPGSGGPFHRLVWNMAERFSKHGEAYFQFITHPTIDPTNNVVEQAMRFVVIDRHVTQGTRSARGREICERLWTVMATCALHKRSPFEWICQSINAHFKGRPAPSLIPDTS
jgi:transposase